VRLLRAEVFILIPNPSYFLFFDLFFAITIGISSYLSLID
jgi:hypothetical protein